MRGLVGVLVRAIVAGSLALTGVVADHGTAQAGLLPRPFPVPLRIAVFGDSSGLMTARGLIDWAAANPGVIVIEDGAVYYGCGLVRDGEFRHAGRVRPLDGCGPLPEQWSRALAGTSAHVALIQVGPIEVDDHLLPGDAVWRAPGDPVFDTFLQQKMIEAVDLVLAHGVTPVWVTSPHIEPPDGDVSRDPARTDRFNELLRGVQRVRPQLRIVDLARFVQTWPRGELDPLLRPDGVHFDRAMVSAFVAPWLVSAIRRALNDVPRPR